MCACSTVIPRFGERQEGQHGVTPAAFPKEDVYYRKVKLVLFVKSQLIYLFIFLPL